MITLTMKQGSQEWLAARIGLPTASCFGKILTPGGKPSAQAEGYMNQLIAERMIGAPCATGEDGGHVWMDRGTALEDEARRWYAFQTDTDPRRVGFVLTDDKIAGASPDAMVGDDGLLEIKCPAASTHVGYLRDDVSDRYKPQLQGQLWVTGRSWVDVVSYCPGFPPPLHAALARVERDEDYIGKLAAVIGEFCRLLDREHLRLEASVSADRRAGVA